MQFRIDVDIVIGADGLEVYRAIFLNHYPIGLGTNPMDAVMDAASKLKTIYGDVPGSFPPPGKLSAAKLRQWIEAVGTPPITNLYEAGENTFYVTFAQALAMPTIALLSGLRLEVTKTLTGNRYSIKFVPAPLSYES